ncbi:MAG: hypothetical protein OEZ37_07200, partial [Gemmatimonadota bacterium]|nr:hypothetical protein [Gemmatimonadota bacterium]
DEGSGYAIGQEALQWVARNADGRGPDTELRDAILAHLRFDEPDGLIQWSADASKGDIAALVPVVASAAEEGDALAQEILVRAAKNLQGHVLAILENLGPWEEPPGIALSGGLLQPGGPLRKLLLALLEEQHLPIVGQVPDPVRGAAQIALEMDRGSTA